ncbi:MAG: hypothetical protein ACD_59C00080G0003 [uncultured bacterium]|nr:MAG: hypothetical protein ACD_59C00080G0003 [uncultured bacterium]
MSVKLGKIKVVIVLVLLASAAYYYLLTNATQAFVFGINYKIHWLVSLSIHFNADTNVLFDDRQYAFQNIIFDDLDIAETLLFNDNNSPGVSNSYLSALKQNNLPVIKLISKYQNLDSFNYVNDALIKVEDPDVFRFLAQKEVNLTYPLVQKTIEGKIELVKLLIDLKVNINSKTSNNLTPLAAALISRNLELVKLFIEKGADVNCKYSDDDSMLIIALRDNPLLDIIKLLVERGAAVNYKNIFGECPICIAAENPGNEEILKYLILKGADKTSITEALTRAIVMGRHEYVDIFTRNGFGINSINIYEWIIEDNYLGLRYLKNNGIDLSQYLQNALKYKRAASLKTLQKAGCIIENEAEIKFMPESKNFLNWFSDNSNNTKKDDSGFLNALKNNDVNSIESILLSGYKLKDNDITTAVNLKCDEKIICLMLRTIDPSSDSYIVTAVNSNHEIALKYLVSETVKKITNDYISFDEPLLAATYLNKYSTVKYILDSIPDIQVNKNPPVEQIKYYIKMSPLICSILNGYDDISQLFIEKGIYLKTKYHNWFSPLIYAAWYGRTRILKMLIDKGFSVNDNTDEGTTALMYAAMAGNTESVSLLIEHGANIEAKNTNGINALVEAITSCRTETVELLKAKGANMAEAQSIIKRIRSKGTDINYTDRYGVSALMRILFSGDFVKSKYLIDNGAEVNVEINQPTRFSNNPLSAEHITTLGIAAFRYDRKFGSINLIKLLLDKGADPYYKNDAEMFEHLIIGTALTSKFFLNKFLKNIPPQLKSANFGRALSSTLRLNEIGMFEVLLENGVGLNGTYSDTRYNYDEGHEIPIFIEIVRDYSIEYLKKILKYRPDVNVRSRASKQALKEMNNVIENYWNVDNLKNLKFYGSNALAFISDIIEKQTAFKIEKLDLLLDNGCDINQKNYIGYTPIMLAALSEDHDIISHMLDKGADIKTVSTDELKFNILFTAALNKNNPDITEMLIDRGADVNHGALFNWTPLMMAAMASNFGAADILIQRDCPVDAVNDDNKNALDIAYDYYDRNNVSKSEMDKIIRLLKKSGLKRNNKIYKLKVD